MQIFSELPISTYVKERLSSAQLERTLGTKMERMALGGGLPIRQGRTRDEIPSLASVKRPRMALLPGEVLQAQMQS